MSPLKRKPALLIAGGTLCQVAGTTGGAVATALITGADIKDGTVTTKDVKDRTLKSADLSAKTVKALKGPRGPAGPPGSTGAPGQNGYQHVSGTATQLAPGAISTIVVECPAGTTVLGGTHTSVPAGGSLIAGGPENFDAWQLRVGNVTDAPVTVTPYAVCTRP
jgi:hypothetical protein